jgi:hypothetical protein
VNSFDRLSTISPTIPNVPDRNRDPIWGGAFEHIIFFSAAVVSAMSPVPSTLPGIRSFTGGAAKD